MIRRARLAAVVVAALLSPAAAVAAPVGVLVHVNAADPGEMRMALNNVRNLVRYYEERGEPTPPVEVVVNGPGLAMLRADESPVLDVIEEIRATMPAVSFALCSNTVEQARKHSIREIEILDGVKIVESGVGYLADRQAEGWAYLKP